MALSVSKSIGSGGFSKVYKATRPDGKVVALKQSHTSTEVKFPLLLHEACILSLLAGHPSIPSVHDWGRSQYFEYLTMDLLGASLADVVKRSKTLDVRTTLLILNQMLDCLEHLHSCHLIHCDVKPDNILFGLGDNSRRIHLVDYGFTRYYRDPNTLLHRALDEDAGFVGTGSYASRNAHLRLSLSRRDDLESLVYTIAFLMRGSLPWFAITSGTHKHIDDRIREKKISYTGKRLFEGFPEEFANFADYVRGLRYDENPNYAYWKSAFLHLSEDMGLSSTEEIDADLVGNHTKNSEHSDDSSTSSTSSTASSYSPEKPTPGQIPVSKGDYILVKLLPSLTIEGGQDDGDTSRWHDPSFHSTHWQFPARPVLVLGASRGTYELAGYFVLSVLPLVHIPGGVLNEEEKRRLVHVGRLGISSAASDRVVIPSPDWEGDSVYHAALPRPLRVAISAKQAPIEVHWKLDQSQLDRLKTMIGTPYLPELSHEARSIVADTAEIEQHLYIRIYASILPLLPDNVPSASALQTCTHQTGQSTGTIEISWSGPRGFLNEWLQIYCRRRMDDSFGCTKEDEPVLRSDQGFVPRVSWPLPKQVLKEDVLQNWESTLKDIHLLTQVPIFPYRILLTRDESMIGRDGRLACIS